MRFILLCERPVRKEALPLHRKNVKKWRITITKKNFVAET